MEPKRAIQRIVTDDSGNIRLIYVDLETLQPVQDISKYQIVNANQQNVEQVLDISDPDPEPLNPTESTGAQLESQVRDLYGEDRTTTRNTERGTSVQPTRGSSTNLSPVNTSQGLALSPVRNTSEVSPVRNTLEVATPVSGSSKSTGTKSTPGDKSSVGFIGNFSGKNRSETPDQGFIDSVRDAVGTTRGLGAGYSVRGESGKDPFGMSYSGSGRHEHGVGMDFDVLDPQGNRVTDNRMQDLAANYAYQNPNAGIGYGSGYMSPGRMHLDQSGLGGQWGAGGKGANMSQALKETIDAARAGNLPTPFDNPGIPYSRDEQAPSGYTPPSATGDYFDTNSLAGLSSSSIAAMEAQRSGISPTVTRSSPGVTVTDDGYTTTTRESIGGWRNNNPGNLKNTDFSKDKGSIGQDYRGFAVFGTLEQGQKAMSDLLFSAPAYSGMTIDQAINRYAPPEDDNNTKGYISAISQALGLPANTKLSDLSPSQRNTMIDTMTRFESGPNTVTEKSSMHTYSGPPSTGNMDSPSERSGGRFGGRGLGVADYDGSSYSGQNRGYDSPSEGNRSSFGGTTSGYSGRDGSRDSPSEGGGRFGGSGLGSTDTGKSGASDKGTSSYGGARSSGDAQSSGRSSSSGGKSGTSGRTGMDGVESGTGTGGRQGRGGRDTD